VGPSRLIQLHDLDGHLRPVEGGDGAEPVDSNALAFGVRGFFLVRGHLRAGAPVDDHRVLGPQSPGYPGRVHRGVAAAVHRDPPADHRPLARGDVPQERHRVDDLARVPGRDVHVLGQVRADGDEHRVEPARGLLGG
jgi:hypothetical protein